MSVRILFVEDDEALRDVLIEAIALEGYRAEGVTSAEEALARLAQEAFDVIVTDITLPGMSGLDLLPHCAQLRPGVIIIVTTGDGTISLAVEAMKRGATDFLVKPFALSTLTGAIRVAAERAERHALAAGGVGMSAIGVISESLAMRELLKHVEAVAPFNTTVLVTGETGTGKEIVARAIHRQSPRHAAPLVALNCAAVPEQLLEDELFGHVKGAFTGAQSGRQGRFEQADGGTLFLDEIGDMSAPLQSKLLRVLQEREFERLGSPRTVRIDVRIVAATSADLERRIAEGGFRADLYYRLNVVRLQLPPLRERREDIRLLAEHLLARFTASAGLPPKRIADDAWRTLMTYGWPGNVRQLQNAMERAAALTGLSPIIQMRDLPEEVRDDGAEEVELPRATAAEKEAAIPDEGVSFDDVVTRVERELLLQSLSKAGGNKMRAARLLNMKRTTFVEKLKRLQINSQDDADTA